MAYSNPVDSMNLLQKLGMIAQSTATNGQSIQPILQQQMQAKQLADVGNVLAGTGIPEFAFKEQTPDQILRTKQQQLAALGNPTAFQAIQQLQDKEITPYQKAQMALQEKEFGLKRQDQNLQRQMMYQNRQDRLSDKADQQNQAYAEKLSKRMSESGAPDIYNAMKDIDAALDTRKDVPGVGPVAGALPDWALSSEGKQLRQHVEDLKSAILKAKSGLTVSDKELAKIDVSLGTGAGRTEQQLRDGVNNVKKMLASKLKTVEAGYPKGALEIYKDAGGINSSHFKSNDTLTSPKGSDLSRMSDADLLKALGD